ncbi:MAG: AAA family ATPase [Candidatus Solibacter sp.]
MKSHENRVPFLKRVVIKNYKSIAACDVELRPLTFLVGPNGSGKSNFLDALSFVSDVVRGSLDFAIRERGGIAEVTRRDHAGNPGNFGMRLEFDLSGGSCHYAFEIEGRARGQYLVAEEELSIQGERDIRFHRSDEGLEIVSKYLSNIAGHANLGPARADQLYLTEIAWARPARPAFDALKMLRFYRLDLDRMSALQAPGAGDILAEDGSNIASVWRLLSEAGDGGSERIQEYLAYILPGIQSIETKELANQVTLEFLQEMNAGKIPFLAANMSEGTVRAFGILVAMFQPAGEAGSIPLVGIDEPETGLHPAVVGVLLDAMRESCITKQLVVATHSPDLLEGADVEREQVLAVAFQDGETRIAPVDDPGREILRRELFSLGEMLRQGQIRPEPGMSGSAHLFDRTGE